MTVEWQDIDVQTGDLESVPCDCCGSTSQLIRGDLETGGNWLAFYTCRWTPAHPDKGVEFRLGTGNWSENTPKPERWMFGATYSREHNGFMLDDLSGPDAYPMAVALDRDDILGTSFAAEAFAMLDAIFVKDKRLQEFRT